MTAYSVAFARLQARFPYWTVTQIARELNRRSRLVRMARIPRRPSVVDYAKKMEQMKLF